MPDTLSRDRASPKPALDLPPPYRLVTLREVGDAFAHAKQIAAEEGAGTLVYVGRFDLAEFAVVLEPEEPLKTARRALYAGLAALADALAVYAPPDKPIAFDWPADIRIDGGLVGGARLGWPDGAAEDEPPAWLVFGGMIRTVAMGEHEPGVRPLSSALDEEGFDELGSGRLVESFARHLMVAIDAWQEKGFAEVARNYLARLSPAAPVPGVAEETGSTPEEVFRGVSDPRKTAETQANIAENGDLPVRRAGQAKPQRLDLLEALAAPSWLDPVTGGPKT
jgi:hypothetical protein